MAVMDGLQPNLDSTIVINTAVAASLSIGRAGKRVEMPFDGTGINGSPWGSDELHFSFPFPLKPSLTVIATCLDHRFCMTITATCHHAAHTPLSMRLPKRPALTAEVSYIESGVKKSMIASLSWLEAE